MAGDAAGGLRSPAMPKPDPSEIRRTGADAFVLDDAGRLLLQLRSDFNRWGLPGGSIEVGETLETAVRREVKEETGVDVAVERLVGVYSEPRDTTVRYPSGGVVHYVSIVFACRVTGGALRKDAESHAVAWFERDALPSDLMPEHRPRIADGFAGGPAARIR